MININELRIGNFLHFVTTKHICEITGICSDGFIESEAQFGKNGDRLSEDFDPIYLTKEWLLKFGFYTNEECLSEFILDVSEFYQFRIRGNELNIWNHSMLLNGTIQYVHQLQNLCFALTGEELQIK